MLTAELVRATRRKDKVKPKWIDPGRVDLKQTAEDLIAIFDRASNATPTWQKGEIDEAIADCVAGHADPLLFRGLCKLLFDRTELDTSSDVDPVEARRELFTLAAQSPMRRAPGVSWVEKRSAMVAEVAAKLGVSTETLEASLYADLASKQRVVSFKSTTPEALLDRYNLALAQGVLIRATRMLVHLSPAKVGAYRQLFRALKFNQLIHTVTGNADGGYTIDIDGPLSLFTSAGRYGVAMARFLPTLALLDGWQLVAEVRWGKDRRECVFELDHRQGLRSHVKAKGQYVTQEQLWFEERFEKKKKAAWSMSRAAEILQTARGEVVVPDLVFENHESGETRYLEIVGFWRAGSLEKRLEQLSDPALGGLLLAVSKRLAGDKSNPPEHPQVVWFKQILNAKEVLARLG